MIKLNGWKRLGILASIIWAIGAFCYTFSTEQRGDISMEVAIETSCDAVAVGAPAYIIDAVTQKCMDEGRARGARMLPLEKEDAAIVALVPVPFAWGFVYLALFLTRWVKHGFAQAKAAQATTSR
jgi:hypothetical protein